MYVGPQVGFVACVAPPGWTPTGRHDPRGAGLAELIAGLCGANGTSRFDFSGEIIGRGRAPGTTLALTELASDPSRPLHGRVAAIFALKQIDGIAAHAFLQRLFSDDAVREFAIRALTDRKTELASVETAPFLKALADRSPRVRAS